MKNKYIFLNKIFVFNGLKGFARNSAGKWIAPIGAAVVTRLKNRQGFFVGEYGGHGIDSA